MEMRRTRNDEAIGSARTKGILVGDDVALGQHLVAEDRVRLELKLHAQKAMSVTKKKRQRRLKIVFVVKHKGKRRKKKRGRAQCHGVAGGQVSEQYTACLKVCV